MAVSLSGQECSPINCGFSNNGFFSPWLDGHRSRHLKTYLEAHTTTNIMAGGHKKAAIQHLTLYTLILDVDFIP